MKDILIILLAGLLLAACRPTTSAGTDYESQWFTYTDSVGGPVKQLCEVRYYVNGDTLFTSEKYHFLTLAYSFDDDNSLMYQHIVYFDRTQQPDRNGWYHIVLNREDIPREPGTHLSAIVLRNCITPLRPPKEGEDQANAYLFNATTEMSRGRDRNLLTPQLSKLLPTIK